MKKIFLLLIVFFTCFQVSAEDRKTIRVSTDNTDLILKVAPNGRLYQSYLGSKLLNEQDIVSLPSASGGDASANGWEVYAGSGVKIILNLPLPLLTMTEIHVLYCVMFLPKVRQ